MIAYSNMKKIRTPRVHMWEKCIILQSFLKPFSKIEQYLKRFATLIAKEERIDLIRNLILVIDLHQFLIHALLLIDERQQTHHLLHALDPLKLNNPLLTFFLTQGISNIFALDIASSIFFSLIRYITFRHFKVKKSYYYRSSSFWSDSYSYISLIADSNSLFFIRFFIRRRLVTFYSLAYWTNSAEGYFAIWTIP